MDTIFENKVTAGDVIIIVLLLVFFFLLFFVKSGFANSYGSSQRHLSQMSHNQYDGLVGSGNYEAPTFNPYSGQQMKIDGSLANYSEPVLGAPSLLPGLVNEQDKHKSGFAANSPMYSAQKALVVSQ